MPLVLIFVPYACGATRLQIIYSCNVGMSLRSYGAVSCPLFVW